MTSNLTVDGLRREIKYVEDCIIERKKLDKDCSFEEDLLKSWCKYLPGGSLHHKLAQKATKPKSGAK